MAALVQPGVVRYAGNAGKGYETHPEAASQTWTNPTFVYLSGGKVTENTVNNAATVVTEGILGIAPMPASGTTDDDVRIELIDGDKEIRMSVYHSTPASAITAITQVGTGYGIKEATVGGVTAWVVDLEDTTNDCVQVTKISPEFAAGEQYGPVYVKVLGSVNQNLP